MQLINYLGFENYEFLIEITDRYSEIQNPGQQDQDSADDRNLNDSFDKQNDSQLDEAEKMQYLFEKNLQHMGEHENEMVSALYVSIIHLIEYICQQSVINSNTKLKQGKPPNKLFGKISSFLNEHRREDSLFNCLKVPDDNVQLAVVQCLFVVSLDDFDMEEIGKITKVMSDCTNIGAGQTELVLSTIYWICTKFALKDANQVESSHVFQANFGEKVINEALHILQKNLVRPAETEDDDKEKYFLSVSILNFIKASTLAPMMQ